MRTEKLSLPSFRITLITTFLDFTDFEAFDSLCLGSLEPLATKGVSFNLMETFEISEIPSALPTAARILPQLASFP